jgi:PKD repeat protein
MGAHAVAEPHDLYDPGIGSPSGDVGASMAYGTWEIVSPMPEGKAFHAVVAYGEYLYAIGGDDESGQHTNTTFRYDNLTDSWGTMTPMPCAGGLYATDGVEIQGKIYLPGGWGQGSILDNTTYVYDIATDTWSTIPANNGFPAVIHYNAVAVGPYVYLLGGMDPSTDSLNTTWVLDTTTETWSPGVPLISERFNFAAGYIDGDIYVAGGAQRPGFTPVLTIEMFNGTAWNEIGTLPNIGWQYVADCAPEGQHELWLAGGKYNGSWTEATNHTGYYSTTTGVWNISPAVPPLAVEQYYTAGDVTNDGYFYVVGGNTVTNSNITQRILIDVDIAPVADFYAIPPLYGVAPLTIQFFDDTSGGTPSWGLWDFGDGETSTLKNPVHTYMLPGMYDVSLTVGNSYGSDTMTKTDYIIAALPPNPGGGSYTSDKELATPEPTEAPTTTPEEVPPATAEPTTEPVTTAPTTAPTTAAATTEAAEDVPTTTQSPLVYAPLLALGALPLLRRKQ